MTPDADHALLAAALEVESERAEWLRAARAALLRGDEAAALRILRRLCGLDGGDGEGDADRRDRDRPGEHGRAGH